MFWVASQGTSAHDSPGAATAIHRSDFEFSGFGFSSEVSGSKFRVVRIPVRTVRPGRRPRPARACFPRCPPTPRPRLRPPAFANLRMCRCRMGNTVSEMSFILWEVDFSKKSWLAVHSPPTQRPPLRIQNRNLNTRRGQMGVE
jgi:hypothetical protein